MSLLSSTEVRFSTIHGFGESCPLIGKLRHSKFLPSATANNFSSSSAAQSRPQARDLYPSDPRLPAPI